MNSIRNILIVVAVIAIAYFAITFVSNIVPILVTAVAAFVLGRLSVHFNLLDLARNAWNARAQAAPTAATTTASVTAAPVAAKAAPAKAADKPAPAEKAAERLADAPKDADAGILLDPDFEIKTPEQIEAEARQREQAALQQAKSASADAVQAALEERRKRLLSGKE